jgi:hypothetical protein
VTSRIAGDHTDAHPLITSSEARSRELLLRIAAEAAQQQRAAGYAAGWAAGYAAAIAEIKGVQVALVGRLGELAEVRAARAHVCCPACRRGGHRRGCTACQDRTAATWADPMPGDFPGRGRAGLLERVAS